MERFLRAPFRIGARVEPSSAVALAVDPSLTGTAAEVAAAIDGANAAHLAELEAAIPAPAYVLAFVRGSAVADRLVQARFFWERTSQLFCFEDLVAPLRLAHGANAVAAALLRIQREALAILVGAQTKLGPAKLVFRLAPPREGDLEKLSFSAIESLVEDLARLGGAERFELRSMLAESDREPLGQRVRESVEILSRRLIERSGSSSLSPDRLGGQVEALRAAGLLHPLLPIDPEQLASTAERLGLDRSAARALVVLGRAARLLRARKPKDLSDIGLKSTVVFPSESPDAQGVAAEIACRAHEALRRAADSHEGLRRFSEDHPHVRVAHTSFAYALPPPLYQAFLHLAPETGRFDLLAWLQLGPAYFQRHFTALLDDPRAGGPLRSIDTRCNGELRSGIEELVGRVACVRARAKRAGGPEVEPLEIPGASPASVAAALEEELATPHSRSEELALLANQIGKEDRWGRIRGIWTVRGE